MIDVAVPERFESEFHFGPFTVQRILRLTLYLVVLGVLVYSVSAFFIVLFPVVLFLVLYRRSGMDLDIYIIRLFKFQWQKRKYYGRETEQIISVRSIRDDVLETATDYSMFIEVFGVSPVLLSSEAVGSLYDSFVSFVNSIDFDVEVRSYPSVLDVGHITSWLDESRFDNENLKRLAVDYRKLITAISENTIYNTTIFILSHRKRYQEESFEDIRRELWEKANVLLSGLYSMGFTAYLLSGEEILDMLKDIYAGVKIVGVPLA
ncbi:MAG: hypothetical protein ACP5QH_00040 [Thermoplasmata archaeon]